MNGAAFLVAKLPRSACTGALDWLCEDAAPFEPIDPIDFLDSQDIERVYDLYRSLYGEAARQARERLRRRGVPAEACLSAGPPRLPRQGRERPPGSLGS